MSYRHVVLVSLALAAACGEDSQGPSHPAANAVDSVLTAMRATYHLPGMAAVVLRADAIEASGVSGVRKQGGHASLTLADQLHLGSNVKAMTSTMLGTLVDEGKLAWTSRPADLFPELAGMIDPALEQITLRDLLEHRAGIYPFTDFTEVPPFAGTPMEQRLLGTSLLLQDPPYVPVGTFEYSNAGYTIAAAMAERVTGTPWEQLMQERVFTPLGMTVTYDWPAATDPSQPWGHEWTGSGFQPHSPHLSNDPARVPEVLAPAGQASMSILDYAKFAQLHLRGLRGQPALVAESTFVRMHTPVVDYALGWGEVLLGGEPTATHNGSSGTFYATIMIQPARNLAVIVVSNAGGQPAADATVGATLQLLDRFGGVSGLPTGPAPATR